MTEKTNKKNTFFYTSCFKRDQNLLKNGLRDIFLQPNIFLSIIICIFYVVNTNQIPS